MCKNTEDLKEEELMRLMRKRIVLAGMIAAGLVAFAGCSGRSDTKPEGVTEEQSEDSEESAASGAEEAEPEESDYPVKGEEEAAPDTGIFSADSDSEGKDKAETGNIFSEMPKDFVFSSGAGGWSTDIEISEDGSFTGGYHDSEMGAIGDGYPNGTVYVCTFSGRFSDPEPTDKEYIYSTKLVELNIRAKEKIGTEEIADDTLYIYSSPYGFDDADEFLIYLPGTPLSELSEECRSWMLLSDSIFKEIPEGYFVLYNIGGQEAFTAQSDDVIWNKNFSYENGSAYVNFSPSYYMGSYLSFFTGDDGPASLALSVPWDGKSSEPLECSKAWENDGTRVKVTIKPDEGSSSEARKYFITVECVSNPQFDFSPWGSTEPGKFSAVFPEKKSENDAVQPIE